MVKKNLILLTILVFAVTMSVEAADWYVRADGNDMNDGRSWATARSTIQSTINMAQPGEVIHVAAGTYYERLQLKDGITLLGEGAETTRIEYGGSDYMIEANKVQSGKLSGFTIEDRGNVFRPTIYLNDSALIITRNIIRGGLDPAVHVNGNSDSQIMENEINNGRGAGIVVTLDARAMISGNIISGNSHGIALRGNSDAQIINNQIKNNAFQGIYIDYEGRGTISGNTISGNGLFGSGSDGILYALYSDPQITNNEIKGNGLCGIHVREAGLGRISGNVVSGNGEMGIYVEESSTPQITDNEIKDNKYNGIYINGASGTMAGNTVSGNGLQGIELAQYSDPFIEDNEIEGNKQNGIFIHDVSRGRISGNIISNNKLQGIEIKEGSDPHITNNEIMNNLTSGVYIHLTARGTISGNIISGNNECGIGVEKGSYPKITDNEIKDHTRAGVLVLSGGHGEILRNIIHGNGSGIEVIEDSDPEIIHNTIIGNTKSGVWIYLDASPDVRNNIIVQNMEYGIDNEHSDGSSGQPTVSFNNVWGNTAGDYNGIDKPITDISMDPIFVDPANGDYHLQPDSPCAGAADDGSDLGAYQVVVSQPVVFPVVIDGYVDAQEWAAASRITKLLSYQNNVTGEKEEHLLEVFYVNDADNLYFGIIVRNDDFRGDFVDAIDLYFDNNNNGIIEENEDIKNFVGLEYGDHHYTGEGNWEFDLFFNGSGRARHTVSVTGKPGDYSYEMQIPLKTFDPQDLSVELGSVIGLKITFREMFITPEGRLSWVDAEDSWPTGGPDQRFDGSTYGQIRILTEDDIQSLPDLPVNEQPWDINKDGKVDISDLVIVGIHFGATITEPLEPDPDVNDDGKVDTLDIMLVAKHFGEVYFAAAPPGDIYSIDERHLPMLIRMCNIMQSNTRSDPDFLVAERLLRELISSIRFSKTEILQNYPNPFNPETWIPYQLTQDRNVTIRIYNATGQLVRTLDIGYKPAGAYISKEKAVYWDGTNEVGEKVASGVYFYTIQAGDFTATKKMVVAR